MNNLVLFADHVDDILVFANDDTSPVLVAERMGRQAQLVMRDPDALPEVSVRLIR